MPKILLEANNLTKTFPARHRKRVHAVSDVSLQLFEGETLGLVGESGCGKSTLGRLLIRLLDPDSGTVSFDGKSVSGLSERAFRPYRRQLQFIFQDPYSSLDPRLNVRDLIAEPLRTWKVCPTRDAETRMVLDLMDAVEIPREFLYRYPHQFSGGQRQRIVIARALAIDPSLIVCDEPVSALDVSVQNQVLNLLRSLQKQRSLTYLFISHDLAVVRHISDRIAVMFLGKICESGPAAEVFRHPRHPYTRFLLNAHPVPDPHRRDEEVQLLSGELPSPVDPPSGCRFRTRCPYAGPECAAASPPLSGDGEHSWSCHHPLER